MITTDFTDGGAGLGSRSAARVNTRRMDALLVPLGSAGAESASSNDALRPAASFEKMSLANVVRDDYDPQRWAL